MARIEALEKAVNLKPNARSHKSTMSDKELRRQVYNKTNGQCTYCGMKLKFISNGESDPGQNGFTIDHVKPISRGGTEDTDNLVPACHECNNLKAQRTLENFRFYKGQDAIHAEYGVRFSRKQAGALKEMGFDLPVERVEFWFEREGVQLITHGLPSAGGKGLPWSLPVGKP